MLRKVHNSGYFGFYQKPKVFCIGFNKSGTTSLHHFFKNQGLQSIHCEFSDGRSLAVEAERASTKEECLSLFNIGQVFSDFTFLSETKFSEPIEKYPLWKCVFPDAYFVFNDRDVDKWVLSRKGHRGGTWLARQMKVFAMSELEVEAMWRDRYRVHKESVLNYFHEDDRFCHFFIGKDEPAKIVNFLRADYSLSAERFGHVNARK